MLTTIPLHFNVIYQQFGSAMVNLCKIVAQIKEVIQWKCLQSLLCD